MMRSPGEDQYLSPNTIHHLLRTYACGRPYASLLHHLNTFDNSGTRIIYAIQHRLPIVRLVPVICVEGVD